MNNKKQLDRYSMMIVSKYFKSIWDFIKIIQICQKFKEIPEMFHYNPVPSTKKINLFPNIETYHFYNKNEKKIEGYGNYVYWYQVNYDTYLKKNENEEFKNVRFSLNDWRKYKSFKGANILGNKSLFRCSFTEIDLTGITKLESYCFMGNTIVKHIKLDKRISTIPDDCFDYCSSLVELDLSHVKILGNSCFNYCSSLTALTLPEMLYEIGKNCFDGINELEKIETKGIKLIEANMNYSLYKSFKTNGIDVKGEILYCEFDSNKYGNTIPEEVSILTYYCFRNVMTIENVILPKSVTKLDFNSFWNCSIKSIDLSNVVENNCFFIDCTELTSITLCKRIIKSSKNNHELFYNYLTSLKNIELSDTNHIPIVSNHLRKLIIEKGYHYDNCIYTQQDRIETNSIIPDEVNIIDNLVFYYIDVKTIIIPLNVTNICLNNFYSMSSLESIEIQSTNLQCGDSSFNNLPKIKELDLRGITSFGNNCVCSCSSLTKVTIQNVPIDQGFGGCNLLKDIEIIGIENNEYQHPINYKVAQLLENKGIHFKRKVIYRYEKINNEETYCIPDGVNEISAHTFYYCPLKEITIPSSVTLIKQYAFYSCNNLTHLIIKGNPQFERYSFHGCIQLIQNQPDLKQFS